MKDTCVVRVSKDGLAHFYPRNDYSIASIAEWPSTLKKKFRGAGIYSIHRVGKPTSRSVRTVVVGQDYYSVPAYFVVPSGYGTCGRFLSELGVTPPPEGKRKTLHLVVTKRRK